MVDRAEIVEAATRLLGEHELACYLGLETEQLRRYGAGIDEVPQLVTLRIVDRVLAESAHPSSTLEAMSDVLREISRANQLRGST
jgi:hypothetical protein